jgi:hypothetical protein
MNTTQGKVVIAYTALANMSRKQLNSFTAYKLFRLKKKLASIVEFQREQEIKIVEEVGGSLSETGEVQFKDKEARAKFVEKQRELGELECEVEGEKISMMPKELPEVSLADMEALEEFIDWKE